jgi:WD40 repeat protein
LHRDIKPGNVLLQSADLRSQIADSKTEQPGSRKSAICNLQSAIPKLTDFGLAKFTQDATQHTRTGAMLGTPAYMAPEQADSRLAAIGPPTDVYALGAVLYEVLTGRPPFQGSNDVDIVQQVLTVEPLAPRRLRPDVPRDLETICSKCLEKEPKRRYASASLLTEDLRAFQAGKPISARPAGACERASKWARRRPAVAALSSVTVAALLSLVAWAVWYTVKQSEHTTALQNALNWAESGERRLREENYAIQIKLADPMQNNDPTGMLGELLNSLRPDTDQEDLRGFEWYYLWNLASRQLHLRGHRANPQALAISPDGSVCASGDVDGVICFWDIRRGKMLKEWQAHEFRIDDMGFSRDGRSLATCASRKGSHDTEMVVWDVAATNEIARLESDSNRHLRCTTIHPDGDMMAFTGFEGNGEGYMLGIWNWQIGKVRYLFRERTITITTLQFSPDGRTLAAGNFHPCIPRCWDLTSGESRNLHSAQGRIRTLSISPDGNYLASGSQDGTIKFWDLTKSELLVTREENDPLQKVAFSPDGKILAIATARRGSPESAALTLWNWPGNDRRKEILKPTFYIDNFAFSPDSKTIAMACSDRHVRLWRPFAEDAVSTLKVRGKKEAWSVAFSPDSRTLAVGYDDQTGPNQETLMLWDVATRQERANLRGHGAMVSCVAFAPDGQTLISAGYDKLIKTWDVRSQQLHTSLEAHTAPVKYVACSPDGQTLVSVGYEKFVRVWNTATGQQRFSLEGNSDRLHAVAFAPNGKEFASACNGGELRILDAATGQALREIKDTLGIMALSYAPNGLLLATANGDGIVKLHDRAGESEPRSLIGHKGEARAIAFSPDGKTLATGGEDRTVRLWQIATGREVLVFKDLPHKVNSVAFSPDGRQLAAAIHDGSVRIWHAPRAE